MVHDLKSIDCVFLEFSWPRTDKQAVSPYPPCVVNTWSRVFTFFDKPAHMESVIYDIMTIGWNSYLQNMSLLIHI